MKRVFDAVQAGNYGAAFEALQRTGEKRTQTGVAVGGFLLALAERFDEADRLLATRDLPAIQLIARGERDRLARWRDPQAAQGLAASQPLPFVGMYAGMAVAMLQRDDALIGRIKGDLQQIPPVGGRITVDDRTRAFRDLADADDAIGRMLETYSGRGLLYFPFATLRRVDFLPKSSFMDLLMPKVLITDKQGNEAQAFVPLLYAGSSTHADETIRNGRMTMFDYIGEAGARRPRGQRDFFADGDVMIGLQGVSAIDFD